MREEDPDWSEYFHEYYYVKGEEWKYEQEYRAVTSSPDESDQLFMDDPFIPEDLTGVILGAAISSEAEAAIRQHLHRYPNARLYRARSDHRTRRVVADPV